MKGNKLYVLAAVLVVLVVLLVLQEKLSSGTKGETNAKFFPSLTEQSMGSIHIVEGSNTIKLRRKGEVWVVSKPTDVKPDDVLKPALLASASPTSDTVKDSEPVTEYSVDSSSIATAIDKLISLSKNALVSENPAKQSVFEVDTIKGITVTITDNSGKLAGSFIMGKSGPDYNSNYVRIKGSNSVYMAGGNIRNSFFTDLTRWRNKSIVKFDKSTAQGLTLAAKDGSLITIAHADSGNPWKIIAPSEHPAKIEAVETILDKLSNLSASEFQDDPLPDTAMGFDKPELGVTVSFKNGSPKNIMFGKKNSAGKYWVKTDGKDQIYLAGEYLFNQLNKKLDDLKGEPLVKDIKADSLK